MGTVSPPQDRQDRLAKLRERADRQYPESWVPKAAGDTIAGEFVRLDTGTTSYGEQTIAVLREQNGVERSVWLLHAVLRNELAKLRPKPGELVLIRYDGKKDSAAGTRYAAYRVEVDREQAPTDWDALADADDVPDEAGPVASDVPADTEGFDTTPRSDDDIPF